MGQCSQLMHHAVLPSRHEIQQMRSWDLWLFSAGSSMTCLLCKVQGGRSPRGQSHLRGLSLLESPNLFSSQGPGRATHSQLPGSHPIFKLVSDPPATHLVYADLSLEGPVRQISKEICCDWMLAEAASCFIACLVTSSMCSPETDARMAGMQSGTAAACKH